LSFRLGIFIALRFRKIKVNFFLFANGSKSSCYRQEYRGRGPWVQNRGFWNGNCFIRLTNIEIAKRQPMKQVLKSSLQATVLMGLTLPVSASAGVLSNLEAQCLCLTEHATLGQLISLGVMLTLVTGIIVLKWVYRSELGQAILKEKTEAELSAIQVLKELKIGTRFSDWSTCNRLAGQK
jgi:hypothetical protein